MARLQGYEWDVETVAIRDCDDAAEGEIIDHAHDTTYAKCLAWTRKYPVSDPLGYEIVLVRDDDECRSWAYVVDGVLEPEFCDAEGRPVAKVPKRFLLEVSGGKSSRA